MNGAPPSTDVPGVALARVRILLLLAGYVIVGLAAGGIFDRTEWMLVLAPVLPTVAALLLVGRSAVSRGLGGAAAIVLSVAIAVVFHDGGVGDFVDAFTSGIQGLLSTDWPSPERPDLIGTVVAVLATATAISDELAGRRRFHLLPLMPLLLCYTIIVGLSAPLGVTWSWLVLLAGVALPFVALRNDGTLHDRLVLLRGERRVVPLLGLGVAIVALVAIPLSLPARADPRRNDPPEQTAPLLDPVEATLALRGLDPPIELHRVVARDGRSLPIRWRTAALESYDGRRWFPDLTLRPIGATLGPVTGPVIDADVAFLDDNLTLVPLPGAPVSVASAIETDPDRTIVRLADPPEPGDEVRIVANVPAETSDAVDVGVAPRLVDENTSGFTELAEALAGTGTPLDQLTQLETTLREDFVLDSEVQGGGLQQALIDRFLRDTQRGTAEQFATAFVLLARSLGNEARMATGFVADSPSDDLATAPDEVLVLTSADAKVWPEVQLTDGRWLAFDPVPLNEADDGAPPPPEPQVQAPAAPQPPIAPPPEPDTETETPDEETNTEPASVLSTVVVWVVRGALGIGALLLPFAATAAVIAGVKYRRRRRRIRAVVPSERVRGAWASATDVLVDAGLAIGISATNGEIADGGEPLVAGARRDLYHLAAMASAATYGSPAHPDLLAEDAVRCLDSLELSMATARTRWQRLRWRLSLRSLRPSTRSPVTA